MIFTDFGRLETLVKWFEEFNNLYIIQFENYTVNCILQFVVLIP